MEEDGSGKAKQKRVRKAPYRKWSEQEQRLLIEFLRANAPIEKPTAQLYYKRFMAENCIELEWGLVRCKVKNLRHLYIKAKAWANSTGADTLQDGETTRDVVLRMCPLYDELDEIFGGYKEYSGATCVSIVDKDPLSSDASVTDSYATLFSDIPVAARHTSHGPAHKGVYSHKALANVLQVQKDVKEEELQLKREKFEFEKEKHASRQRFKMLKLEMTERIAMKKLEMKERIEMELIRMLNSKEK